MRVWYGPARPRRQRARCYHGAVRHRRVAAKFGTSLLTAGSDRLDLVAMSQLVGQVMRLRGAGCEVAVVSSGARAAGRHALAHRPAGAREPSRQALASAGQSRLMQSWDELFQWHDAVVAQVLLTRRDLSDRLGYLNARETLRDLLDCGAVPIVNENDAVALDEVLASRIGENDSLSAFVANLIDADLLVILTDVDGLHTADPSRDPEAELIAEVTAIDERHERAAGGGAGLGGMEAKLAAARVAAQGGATVVIANGRAPDALVRAATGEPIGTRFAPAANRLEGRKRWILGNAGGGGRLVVDGGAVAALREHGRSLLPAGVRDVEGVFERGDAIEVRDASGARVAAGITNYASGEALRIRGLRSDLIAETLGYAYGDEVIHRDNLVLL